MRGVEFSVEFSVEFTVKPVNFQRGERGGGCEESREQA